MNYVVTGMISLGTMYTEDHIMVGRRGIWRDVVPETPTIPQPALNYTIQEEPTALPIPDATSKNETVAKIWELQKLYFFSLHHISQVEELPRIYKMISPLPK